MTLFDDDHDTQIRSLIRSCGQQAKQMAAQGLEVFEKAPADFVTNVDRALDRQLSAGFARFFPDDGVITEENSESRQQFQAGNVRLWCIDPIDGTEDFIRQRPDYAVMVGLLEKEQPVAGWIYAPEPDVMYYGGHDRGLWKTLGSSASEPLAASHPQPPSPNHFRLIVGNKDRENFGAAIAQSIPEVEFVYSLGSFGLKVMNVIMGQAGLYLYLNGRVKVWDTVAPLALAKVAGLVCCDLDGNELSYASDKMNLETLAHQQSIVIGWEPYVESLLPKMRSVVASVINS
jgi:3'(2'), 5'-bisphosphate nucleotidase